MPLARLFAWLDRVLSTGAPHAAGLTAPPAFSAMVDGSRPARDTLPMAALLSVDGAGQFLLCGGERLTLGHLRAGQADLLFLADVGVVHATLVRADSLHAGPGWRIVPCGEERVTVAGVAVPATGKRLAAGERVQLGENLEFSLALPDPASATAVLELARGAECAGARHIVLLSPGPGGRVRIGSTSRDHVRVPGLDFDLVLEWGGDELELASELPLEGALEGSRLRMPFPPRERLALACGKPRGSRPPFGLSFEAVNRP